MSGNGGLDFYSVSVTHGYNLAMLVVPQGDYEGNCMASACVNDPNGGFSSETGNARSITCFAFGDPKNCCNGANARPGMCKPTEYSMYFGSRCPWADSYVYGEDDGREKSGTFGCSLADYHIPSCPRPSLATGHQVDAVAGTPPSSAVKAKKFVIIVLVVVTMVIAILLTAFKILSAGLAVATVSAIYTALALLFML
ncbi:hypothetical protein RJ640_022162 [Escallonia rubra]|uniref:Uncharacterized protein n=1 Tax=Escallonia rubra TaxID=112253 RepID=A0AA88U8M1_9ASTE|nr:hypothetical protein RJ640_022162 [Escallonia rubra]